MDENSEKPNLISKKNWMDEAAWYLMVMGFIGLLLAGLCFFFFRNRPLSYPDFNLNANVLGKYLLIVGMSSYAMGRGIYYYRRYRQRRLRPTE